MDDIKSALKEGVSVGLIMGAAIGIPMAALGLVTWGFVLMFGGGR